MNEAVSGEASFSGWSYIWFFNHLKKWQTASAHHIYCGRVDGGYINPLEYTIVEQQLESKSIFSIFLNIYTDSLALWQYLHTKAQ